MPRSYTTLDHRLLHRNHVGFVRITSLGAGWNMGDLGLNFEDWYALAPRYREQAIFLLAAALTLMPSIWLARNAAAWIDALDCGSFSAERRGNKTRRPVIVQKQLNAAREFQKRKWIETGSWVGVLLFTGIVVPTFWLMAFAVQYGLFFADGFALVDVGPDCMRSSAAHDARAIHFGKLLGLFVTSVLTEHGVREFLPQSVRGDPWFSLAYNLEERPVLIAFLAHKFWAVVYVWQLTKDFLWKLTRIAWRVPERIDELNKKLAELRAEQ